MKGVLHNTSSPDAPKHQQAFRLAVTVGLACGLALAIRAYFDVHQALVSYLFAYASVMTLVMGALFILLLSNLTGARWFLEFRAIAVTSISSLPAIALLTIPILAGLHMLYPWTDLSRLAPHVREVVERKEAWLNTTSFVMRSIAYLVIWVLAAELLRSTKAVRQGKYSAPLLIAVGVSFTFACFDWLMSLEPDWYSTIYGVYVFAGGVLSSLAFISIARSASRDEKREGADEGAENNVSTPMAKLLLTFAMFWGYIAFSQYLIVWIADLPSEVSWYASRASGAWGWLAVVVGLAQLVIPFALLVSAKGKRSQRVIRIVCVMLLAGHVLDIYWLVMPALSPADIPLSWTDPVALMSVAALTIAGSLWRAQKRNDAVELQDGDAAFAGAVA